MDGCIHFTNLRVGLIGLCLLFVVSAAHAVEPRKTATVGGNHSPQPVVKAPVRVVALTFIEPDGTRVPVVEVWSNGQVNAIERRGTRQNPLKATVTDRLSPSELQGLHQLLFQDCQLGTQTTEGLNQSLRRASQKQQLTADIAGAAATEIGILNGQEWRTVTCPALSILTTRFPDVVEVQNVAAAQSSLQNIAAVALVGGGPTADSHAAAATQKLREVYPDAGSITRRQLTMVRRLPNGSQFVQFHYAGDAGHDNSCLVSVTKSPEGPAQVSVMESPTVVR